MKRILIFSITYFPFIGGAEVAIKEITERIPEYKFDMITLRVDSNLPRFERIGNVNVYRIGASRIFGDISSKSWSLTFAKLLFPFIAFFKAQMLWRKHKYDSIWAMMANRAGFAAMFFKTFHPNVKYILTLQEGDPLDVLKIRVKFIHPLFKLIFTKADIIQTISNYLAGFAKEMTIGKKIVVIPNGVDVEHFSKDIVYSEIESLKRELKKVNVESGELSTGVVNSIYLITTSRLVPKNAVQDTILSLKYLPSNVKLVVVGGGPDAVKIQDMTMENGLDSRVMFVGQIKYEDIPKYLKVCDIFVRPSISEGFGNSFIEAMAAGLPVIATPVGGIVDFIFDPVRNMNMEPTGYFCEVNNPKSVAEKVDFIMKNEGQKKQIIANAFNLVKEKYDWSIIAKDMKEKVL